MLRIAALLPLFSLCCLALPLASAQLSRAPDITGSPSVSADVMPHSVRAVPRGVRRERPVSVDRSHLTPDGTPTPTVAMTLFDGNQVLVDLVRVEVRGPNNYTWFGRVRDYDRSDVVLSVVDGVLAGGIGLASSTSGEAAPYRLQPIDAGSQYLQELDTSKMPPDHPPGWTGEPPPGLLAPQLQPNSQSAQTPQADSSAQVDVMVVYSDQTAAAAGGGIGAEIQYAIDRANLAYNNSGVTTQLRLVAWGMAGYSESGDFNTDLTRLATVGDGYMDAVDGERNTYAADVVALLIENPAYCGLGYLNATATSAFVVVNRDCAGGYLSLAHEIGHNFGARHDPYMDATTTPYAYGHGYVNLAGQWRTVLAYDNQCNANGFSCTRIPYFSTPLFTYLGSPVGTAATHDNARVHNNRAFTVANFRTASVVAAPTVSTSPATAITSSGATLNGVVSANGASTTVVFEFGQTAAYGSSLYATGSPFAIGTTNQAVSGTVIGLAPCLTLHYRITAANSAGTTSGADSTFTTAGCASAPTATTNTASGVTNTGATLNGTVSSNGASTAVQFQYGLTTAYGNSAALGSALASSASNQAVSAATSSLDPCSIYHFRVTATNSAGTTNGADSTFATTGCAGPPTVTVGAPTGVGQNGATLNGTVLSNNLSAVVTFFYGPTTAYGTSVVAAQSPVTTSGSAAAVSATLLNLVCGTTYHWFLQANSAGGATNSLDQTFTTATCTGGGGAKPPTVTTNAINGIGPTSAWVNGTVSSNGASTTVRFEYGIGSFISSFAATPATLAATASNQGVGAALLGLTCATTYQYRVVASNSAGATVGNGLSFTTSACSAVAATSTALTSTANPAVAGTTVTFMATVAGNLPVGNVAFWTNGDFISGCDAVPLQGSGNTKIAFCSMPPVAAGNLTINADFLGDGNNQPSSATPLLQSMVTAGSLTGTIIANPYGPMQVTGGNINGSTVTLVASNVTLQLGSVAGSSNYAEIDFSGFHWGPGTLTIRSGAANQLLVLKNVGGNASAIAGTIVAEGGNGAAPPQIYFWNPNGIALGAGALVQAPSGLILDALANTAAGGSVTNAGTADGGAYLEMWGATIKGAGSYKGNEVDIHTFGTVNNPVAGAHFLGNSLQVYPSTGTDVALLLNSYGAAPQFINVKVNGNALVWMPSGWPSTFTLPTNSAPLPEGGSRAAGVGEPTFGGGSIILQTTGSMTLFRGGANDFVFPGGIALKAGSTLDFNGVTMNQGWTTTGKSFQGIYLEAAAITSATPVQVWSNDLNWMNFSVRPTGHFQVSRLTAQPNGTASFVPADSEAPHLNTYSTLLDAAANLQCWTCLVNFTPITVQ